MEDQNQIEKLFPEGFTGFRTGLREHINNRRFTLTDAAVYLYLHMHSTWRTGICYTCAPTIAALYNAPVTTVNDSFSRMRRRRYVNYPPGKGQRGLYPVLIHKARPTVGVLFGYELDAFASKDFDRVVYFHPNGSRVEAVWKSGADRAETVLMTCGDRVLTVCIQDDLYGVQGVNGLNGQQGEGGGVGLSVGSEPGNPAANAKLKPCPQCKTGHVLESEHGLWCSDEEVCNWHVNFPEPVIPKAKGFEVEEDLG